MLMLVIIFSFASQIPIHVSAQTCNPSCASNEYCSSFDDECYSVFTTADYSSIEFVGSGSITTNYSYLITDNDISTSATLPGPNDLIVFTVPSGYWVHGVKIVLSEEIGLLLPFIDGSSIGEYQASTPIDTGVETYTITGNFPISVENNISLRFVQSVQPDLYSVNIFGAYDTPMPSTIAPIGQTPAPIGSQYASTNFTGDDFAAISHIVVAWTTFMLFFHFVVYYVVYQGKLRNGASFQITLWCVYLVSQFTFCCLSVMWYEKIIPQTRFNAVMKSVPLWFWIFSLGSVGIYIWMTVKKNAPYNKKKVIIFMVCGTLCSFAYSAMAALCFPSITRPLMFFLALITSPCSGIIAYSFYAVYVHTERKKKMFLFVSVMVTPAPIFFVMVFVTNGWAEGVFRMMLLFAITVISVGLVELDKMELFSGITVEFVEEEENVLGNVKLEI